MRFLQRALDLRTFCRSFRPFRSHASQRVFAILQADFRLLEDRAQFFIALTRCFVRSKQLLLFLIKTRQNIGILTHHLLFTGDISRQLFEPLHKFGAAGPNTTVFFIKLRASDGKALQSSSSLCFCLTHFG